MSARLALPRPRRSARRWLPAASTAAMVAGAGILAALVVVSLASLESMAGYRLWVLRAHGVMVAITAFESKVKDAEIAARSYRLLRRDEFLAPYRQAVQDLPGMVAALRDLVGVHPDRSGRLGELERQAGELVAHYGAEIAAAAAGVQVDPELARDIKARMDALRWSVATWLAAEQELRNQRQQEEERAYRSTWMIISMLGGTAVIGLLAAAASNQYQLRRRTLAEAELRHANATLEAAVAERTSELRAANRGLEVQARDLAAANRDLESFSYSVSHDLRSPLRSIEGFTALALRRLGGRAEPDVIRQMEIVRASAQHMGRLISDVLAFSRLGREALRPQRVDMRVLAERVVAERRGELAGRRVDIAIAPDLPPCIADPSLMYLVVANLIGNAIKYTRERAEASIRMDSRQGAQPPAALGEPPVPAGQTVYVVADDGAGFDMRYYDKLFGVFQRLHESDRFEGNGIGLATVKRVIERHRGRIWASGRPGAGAEFCFTIGELP